MDKTIEMHNGLTVYPDQILTNKERYQSLIEKLIYLTHIQPYLSYDASGVTQFMHNLSDRHMEAMNRILAYLKSSPDKGTLVSKHGHLNITGYTTSNFVGSKMDK